MKAAILISTYNGEQYLKEQIESILNQKCDIPFDIIVRDDGSTDKTCEILEKYASEGKLKFKRDRNMGAARGFLKLLKETAGYDYYAFSDQDDIWKENKIQRAYDAIKDCEGPALYCSNSELVDSQLNSFGRNTHRAMPNFSTEAVLCLASCAQGCTSMMNDSLAKVIQSHDIPDRLIMHDSWITCLCALIGGAIVYDDTPSMLYRMHGNNVFGMKTKKQGGTWLVLKDRYRQITRKKKVSTYDQIQAILNEYGEHLAPEQREIGERIIRSEHSLIDRLRLVFNPRLKCETLNMTITKKLEVLFGND